ncbi:MAG: outer membrane protein transport protein, partial [Desulfocapsa sp.]|nr:outer membrane protein transport protein [Desulfocapsa sp.]
MLDIDSVAFDLGSGILHAERSITNPMISTDSDSENYFAVGAGAVAKISDKLYFGLAAGGVAGLGTDFAQSLGSDEATAVVTTKGLLKLTPTIAYKPTDKLSIGVSAQIGYQTLALSSAMFDMPQAGEFGFGASIGAIYEVSPEVQLGAAYTSEMNVSEYEFHGTYAGAPGTYLFDMDAPASAAFGVAFTPLGDFLLVEADVKWIGFSDVMDSIDLKNAAGDTLQPISFGWEDQIVYSLGLEVSPIDSVTLRLGYNYGETGIDPEDVQHNLGAVAVVEHHLSLGVSKQWTPNLKSSLSYTHGFENSVTGDIQTPGGLVSHTLEASQDIVYFQLSYRM